MDAQHLAGYSDMIMQCASIHASFALLSPECTPSLCPADAYVAEVRRVVPLDILAREFENYIAVIKGKVSKPGPTFFCAQGPRSPLLSFPAAHRCHQCQLF